VRAAEPSGAVWDRIAGELAPSKGPSRPRGTFQRASFLSLALLLAAGVAGVGTQALTLAGTAPHGPPTGVGESALERSRLEVASMRAWDRIPPPAPLPIPQGAPKEAYNRGIWMAATTGEAGSQIVPSLPIYRQ
jgi:hypothetical protein